jgi:plasmid stabilization system protein ParE
MRAAELRREVQASYEQQVRGLAQRPAAQWVGALSDLGRVVAPRADAPRAGGVEVDIPGLGRQWFRSSADAQAALAEIAAGRARR